MDLSYIDPQARNTKLLFLVIKAINNQSLVGGPMTPGATFLGSQGNLIVVTLSARACMPAHTHYDYWNERDGHKLGW